MSTYIAQYVKSDDPEVIAATRLLDFAFAAAKERGHEFARKYGSAEGVFVGRDGEVHGVITDDGEAPKDAGRWKKVGFGNGGHAWMPWASNPVISEMRKIRVERNEVPGVPNSLEGAERHDGSRYVSWYPPRPFLLDGVAYNGVGFQPVAGGSRARRGQDWGPQWAEISGGEFHSAIDAYNARIEDAK